jgi:hypothetical protein
MTTTFEKFPNNWYQNYCSRPTIDVEIINPSAICDGRDFIPPVGESVPGNRGSYGPRCHKPITYTPHPKGDMWTSGTWTHVDGSTDHYTSPTSRCFYCGNNDPATVRYVQQAWSNQTECDRCGGSHGYAIGD